MPEKNQKKLENIKVLILDVDGVLTDGSITIDSHGNETKTFNALDGHGIKMWQRAGLQVAFLSGRFSKPTQLRADQLNIEHCFQDCKDKLPVLKQFIEQNNLKAENIAYVGDDLPDLPILEFVGFSVTVPNAPKIIKENVDFVTITQGGSGAVRELIEYILKKTNKWDQLLEKYKN